MNMDKLKFSGTNILGFSIINFEEIEFRQQKNDKNESRLEKKESNHKKALRLTEGIFCTTFE